MMCCSAASNTCIISLIMMMVQTTEYPYDLRMVQFLSQSGIHSHFHVFTCKMYMYLYVGNSPLCALIAYDGPVHKNQPY